MSDSDMAQWIQKIKSSKSRESSVNYNIKQYKQLFMVNHQVIISNQPVNNSTREITHQPLQLDSKFIYLYIYILTDLNITLDFLRGRD